jgi:hypothetical protein
MSELRISFGNVNEKNIELLAKINEYTLPVNYSRPLY